MSVLYPPKTYPGVCLIAYHPKTNISLHCNGDNPMLKTQDPWTLSRVSFQTERIQSETAPGI